MENPSDLTEMERDLAATMDEASRIVRAAEAESRELSRPEDERVLSLLKQARALEEQIGRSKRHHNDKNARGRTQ